MEFSGLTITDVRELPSSSSSSPSVNTNSLIIPRRWTIISLSLRTAPDAAQTVIASRIARCCGEIDTLALSGLSDGGAWALGESLTRAKSTVRVQDAVLDGARIGDIGAHALSSALAAGALAFGTLRLTAPRLTLVGVGYLAAALPSATLEEIDLSGCSGIGAAGAICLSVALRDIRCKLLRLRLADCDVGDAGADAIARALGDRGRNSSASSLGLLDLARCGIGAKGAASIARTLARGTQIEAIDLSGNTIGDVGAVTLAAGVLAASRTSPSLTISLKGNGIGRIGAMAFSGAVRAAMRRVASGGASGSGASGISGSGGVALTALDLSDNNSIPRDVSLTLLASMMLARFSGIFSVSSTKVGRLGEGGAGGGNGHQQQLPHLIIGGGILTAQKDSLAAALGVAVSLASGGSGLDSRGTLSNATRLRILTETFGSVNDDDDGTGNVFNVPSTALLRIASEEVAKASFRAASGGAELQEGNWPEFVASETPQIKLKHENNKNDVDHELIAQLVAAARRDKTSALVTPPSQTNKLSTGGEKNTNTKHHNTPPPIISTHVSTPASTNVSIQQQRGAVCPPPIRFSVDLTADDNNDDSSCIESSSINPELPLAQIKAPTIITVVTAASSSTPSSSSSSSTHSSSPSPSAQALSPVSRGLAECLPPELLNARIDTLSGAQLAAVIDLARALQRDSVSSVVTSTNRTSSSSSVPRRTNSATTRAMNSTSFSASAFAPVNTAATTTTTAATTTTTATIPTPPSAVRSSTLISSSHSHHPSAPPPPLAATPSAQSPLPLPRRSRVGRDRIAATSNVAVPLIHTLAEQGRTTATSAFAWRRPTANISSTTSSSPPQSQPTTTTSILSARIPVRVSAPLSAPLPPRAPTLSSSSTSNAATTTTYAELALRTSSLSPQSMLSNGGSYARVHASMLALPSSPRGGSPETV